MLDHFLIYLLSLILLFIIVYIYKKIMYNLFNKYKKISIQLEENRPKTILDVLKNKFKK